MNHELLRSFLLDVSYLHTRERDPQGTFDNNIGLWPSQYTQVTLNEPGRDGVFGTGDERPITVFSQNAGVTMSTRQINDDRNGPERHPVNGDRRNPTTLIPAFLSPTGFLAPRVARFKVTYKFPPGSIASGWWGRG